MARWTTKRIKYRPHGHRAMAMLPNHSSHIVWAQNPWHRAELPITARPRRRDLWSVRKSNPLPEPSPFWQAVEF